MQKIILDTNIIVSALLTPSGIPSKVLKYLILGRIVKPQLSKAIFDEYVMVLSRLKFQSIGDFETQSKIVLNRLWELAEVMEPDQRLHAIADEPDNRFLELALKSEADFLITGNSRDFKLSSIGKTRIVGPSEYWEQFAPAK